MILKKEAIVYRRIDDERRMFACVYICIYMTILQHNHRWYKNKMSTRPYRPAANSGIEKKKMEKKQSELDQW